MDYFDVLFAKKQSGGGAPTLITKTITENGTYNASDDNADGYSSVTVAVDGFKKKYIANTPTDIASFNDGTANPMPSLEISIVPVQSGSGDPSPSNVRPISGWSGAKIADDAEYGGFINWNQLVRNGDFESASGWSSIGGTTIATLSIENKKATVTLIAKNNSAGVYRPYFVDTSVENHVVLSSGFFTASSATNITYNIYNLTDGGSMPALTTPINANTRTNVAQIWRVNARTSTSGLYAYVDRLNELDIGATVVIEEVQFFDLTLMFGSTIADYIHSLEQATAGAGVAYFRNLFPHDYYPYNAGTITTVSAVNEDVDKYSITSIPFHDSSDNPITVYGGTLNVTSGELRADRAIVDLGTLNWERNPTYPGLFNGRILVESTKVSTVRHICSIFIATDSTSVIDLNNSIAISASGITVYVHDDSYNDAASFKTAMDGVQLVYELATPQTYQLTPTQVTTLLGQNNIFADCGQILEGEYFVTL